MECFRHADDFGATPEVNLDILEIWRAGGISSFSIIANGDGVEEGALAVAGEPRLPARLAVHLNLSEGMPIADPASVDLLVDDSGHFRHGFASLWWRWFIGGRSYRQRLLGQIETEWRTQVLKVIQVMQPRKVTAIDGHLHIHMLPFLFPVAVKLAKEHSISEIRISREIFHFSPPDSLTPGFAVNIVKHLLLNRLARPAFKLRDGASLSGPDAIAGVLYSGRMSVSTYGAAREAARKKGVGNLEILFHPGRAEQGESSRWRSNPGIGLFYTHENRDSEREALHLITSAEAGKQLKEKA